MVQVGPNPSFRNETPVSGAARGDVQTQTETETTPLLGRSTTSNSLAEDIDSRFRRWKRAVAQRMKHGKHKESKHPTVLISVFDGDEASELGISDAPRVESTAHRAFDEDVEGVRSAILAGVLPKMITTGSSGSYFARLRDDRGKVKICGVFKPADEEPYGNLNPKRAFLRRYFWWAMGRPCLIAGFSAMSEAGASLLDERLQLGLVPITKLVQLSSPSFHYHYSDRMAFEHHGTDLPQKIGSFQSFLQGYTMASTFLRSHPFPSRPRSVLERDLAAEQRAHRKSRKQYSARLRKFLTKIKYTCLCRQGLEDIQYDAVTDIYPEDLNQQATAKSGDDSDDDDDDNDGEGFGAFLWTPELLQAFRLELEKLVVFDYLCRNTDRGLDNFMVKYSRQGDTETLRLGAIDNSLAWPIKHPDGIREYPFGWLYLPSDLIGGPFAQSTRDRFLPILSSPTWWRETEDSLRALFQQDEHFNAKLFESQMAVFKGQGWNLVQSLRTADEGPLELCARPKKVVHQSIVVASEGELEKVEGHWVALVSRGGNGTAAPTAPHKPDVVVASSASKAKSKAVPTAIGRAGTDSSAGMNTDLPVGLAAYPQSLPETSSLSQVAGANDAAYKSTGAEAAATPSVRPGSLGIEVVEEMNKASRKRHHQDRRSQSQQRIPSKVSDDAVQSPSAAPQRWGRHNSRRYTSRHRPSARRDNSVGDVLSEDEEDRYVAQTGDDGGSRDELAQSLLSEPDLDGGANSRDLVQDRMASSDYFAGYHSRVESGGGESEASPSASAQMPSIDALVSHDYESMTRAPDAVGSLRGNLGKSYSYAPAPASTSSTSAAAAAAAPPGPPPQRIGRRRMRSVGQWSLSSLSSAWREGDEGDEPGNGDEERPMRRPERKIKAIIEKLVDDKSLPWQAWLRA